MHSRSRDIRVHWDSTGYQQTHGVSRQCLTERLQFPPEAKNLAPSASQSRPAITFKYHLCITWSVDIDAFQPSSFHLLISDGDFYPMFICRLQNSLIPIPLSTWILWIQNDHQNALHYFPDLHPYYASSRLYHCVFPHIKHPSPLTTSPSIAPPTPTSRPLFAVSLLPALLPQINFSLPLSLRISLCLSPLPTWSHGIYSGAGLLQNLPLPALLMKQKLVCCRLKSHCKKCPFN